MPPKIKITSKKRTASAAGLTNNHSDDDNQKESKKQIKQQQEKDLSQLAESGVVNRYEAEVPQENDEEEAKRRAKREYQKKKVKKQKMSKKALEVVDNDNDLVKLVAEAGDNSDDDALAMTSLTYHMGIVNKKDNLRLLKKKKRLNLNLLAVDEDKEVLLGDDDIQHVINNPKNKLLPKNHENYKHSTSDKATNTKLTKAEKANKKSMLSNEVSAQLALLNMVADKQEAKASTKIEKEKAKVAFFDEKEKKKLEKKEREKHMRNVLLNEVRQKQKTEKDLKKELK